jgi:hypothetical protein
MSAKEDNDNNPLSLPLVTSNGSIGGALLDIDCLWRVFSLRWLQFATCAGSGNGGAAMGM